MTRGSNSATRVTDGLNPAPGGSRWQTATVVDIRPETANAKTFRLALPAPSLHLAGQHYIVRLTAPDGYTASRSYSVASAPDGSAQIELTVEKLPDGEVSSFLHDVVVPGDNLDVRGPVGRWFVWRGDTPALLVGGGSGVVPLMSMLRLARRTGHTQLLQLLVSARSPADLYYRAGAPGPGDHRCVHPLGSARMAATSGAPDRRRPVRAGGAGRDRVRLRLPGVCRRGHRSTHRDRGAPRTESASNGSGRRHSQA